jgi:hypothetical protein
MKKQPTKNRIAASAVGTQQLATRMLSCAKGGGSPAPPDPNPDPPPILDGKDN